MAVAMVMAAKKIRSFMVMLIQEPVIFAWDALIDVSVAL